MAAIGPINTSADEAGEEQSRFANILRLVIVAVLIGVSAYLVLAHRQWLENPKILKGEVLSWGIWGPIIYIALYAVGPSFLVPGALMTVAGGLAFGALRGAAWSLIGANTGALVAFEAGRFLGRSFVERSLGTRFKRI